MSYFRAQSFTVACLGLGLVAGLGSVLPRSAAAAVILQQDPIQNGPAALSDSSVQAFDDFKLAAEETVRSVTWWSQDVVPHTEAFTITFTRDGTSNFYPDPQHPIYTASVTATSVVAGSFLYEYQANLPSAAILPADTDLWISIVGGANFAWASASDAPSPGGTGGPGLSVSQLGNGTLQLGALDLAWSLNGSLIPGLPVNAPEPAGIALFAVALAGMTAVIFHRRRTAWAWSGCDRLAGGMR